MRLPRPAALGATLLAAAPGRTHSTFITDRAHDAAVFYGLTLPTAISGGATARAA